MKKKNLKNLALNRRTVSNLEAGKSLGGNTGNSVIQCVLTYVNANGVNICLQTLDCVRTAGCNPPTLKNCVSIQIDCITQTEFPTCRDCA